MSKTTDTATAAATPQRRNVRRAAASGFVGSALEYYDFALYSQASALVFPAIFFASDRNRTIAIIASLATYAVGYVARPVGAVVLGAWGDRRGRKNVLVLAMMLMGVSTLLVGFLPTYHQIGVWAPALLVVLRLVQGFAVAGELGGASAMIVEHAPDGKRGFFASFALQGTQFGSILATAAMLPLAAANDQLFKGLDAAGNPQWFGTWRIPFWLSAMVIIAGIVIRRGVQEPQQFEATRTQVAVARRFPLLDLLRHRPKVLILCILMTFTNVIGMATLTFGVAFATQDGYTDRPFTTGQGLWLTLAANIAAVAMIPLFGALSDKVGRKPFMVFGGLVGGALTMPYLFAIQNHNVWLAFVLVVIVQGTLFQMWNAVFATFYQEQFPARMRVTGFAVAQNVGLMLASFFPAAFTAIAPPGSDAVPVRIGLVSLGICAVAAIATLMAPGTKDKTLADLEA